MKEAFLWLSDVVGSCPEYAPGAISIRTQFPVVAVTCTVQYVVEHERPFMGVGILLRSDSGPGFCLNCSSRIGLSSRFLPGCYKIEEANTASGNHKNC